MDKYSVISLFSGCGGLDLGFLGDFVFLNKYYKENRYDIIWANDIDKNACKTYQKNFNHGIFCGDIWDVLNNKSGDLYGEEISNDIKIVLGGFPCQDFSHSGNRKGLNSHRGNLYKAMMEVIRLTKPYLFLAENVKGLLTLNNGRALATIVNDFDSLGYHITHELLLSSNYEVPQKRERVLIVGTRKDALPEFLFGNKICDQEEWITLGKAIGDLENLDEGEVKNHFWSKAKRNKGQGNNCVSKDQPGPTMRAEHHGNIEFHWNNERRLSAREAARIQSFPDEFIFYPSTSSAYKQVGNAVPPVFAWHIANMIQEFLDRYLISK